MSERLGKNLVLLLVSLLLILFCLEMGIRFLVPSLGDLLSPRGDFPPPAFFESVDGKPTTLQQYDSNLGWVNRPEVEGVMVGPDKVRTAVAINSRGLRDEEIDYAKPPGRRRILILGDSFAWGYGLTAPERFSDILGKMFPDIQVINMGVSGYSTDQECIFFELEGLKYTPDMLVLLVHDTDIFHNGLSANYGKSKPYFILEGDSLLLRGSPVPRKGDQPQEDSELKRVKRFLPLRFLKEEVFRRSRLYQVISSRLKMIDPVKGFLIRLGLVEAEREMEDDVRLTGAIIERMRRSAAAAGVSWMLVVLVPSKEVVNYYLPPLSGRRSVWRIKDSEIIKRERAVAALFDFLQSRDIAVIDFSGRFEQLARGGENLYFESDNHWNARANREAAELVGEFLVEAGFN